MQSKFWFTLCELILCDCAQPPKKNLRGKRDLVGSSDSCNTLKDSCNLLCRVFPNDTFAMRVKYQEQEMKRWTLCRGPAVRSDGGEATPSRCFGCGCCGCCVGSNGSEIHHETQFVFEHLETHRSPISVSYGDLNSDGHRESPNSHQVCNLWQDHSAQEQRFFRISHSSITSQVQHTHSFDTLLIGIGLQELLVSHFFCQLTD